MKIFFVLSWRSYLFEDIFKKSVIPDLFTSFLQQLSGHFLWLVWSIFESLMELWTSIIDIYSTAMRCPINNHLVLF